MTPYYSDDLVTIYHGDALALIPGVPECDLLLTDPPYNVGVQYGEHDDHLSDAAYIGWCHEWFRKASLVTRRQLVFPGHGNLPIWWQARKPSAVGCWYKPGNPASSHLGWSEWEPYLYWGTRVGGRDVVTASIPGEQDTGGHPCPKPIRLIRELIAKFKPESVLDPFMGSGTTVFAAKWLGVPSIGIEIEERYCEIAATRCSQEVLGLAV